MDESEIKGGVGIWDIEGSERRMSFGSGGVVQPPPKAGPKVGLLVGLVLRSLLENGLGSGWKVPRNCLGAFRPRFCDEKQVEKEIVALQARHPFSGHECCTSGMTGKDSSACKYPWGGTR